MNDSTYYYYRLDVPDHDRVYTIEFSCETKDEAEQIVKKTLSAAKGIFDYLNIEFKKLNEIISQYIKEKQIYIKKTQTLSSVQYFELGDQFIKYESKQCERFKDKAHMGEFELLHKILCGSNKITRQFESQDALTSDSTHFSTLNEMDIILVKVFKRSTQKGIFDFTLDKRNIVPKFKVNADTFIIETFEKYTSVH